VFQNGTSGEQIGYSSLCQPTSVSMRSDSYNPQCRWTRPRRYQVSPFLLDGRESVGYDRAMAIKRVCVYCASVVSATPPIMTPAARLGRELARNKVTLVLGGG